MQTTKILQNGNLFEAAVLDLTTENILSRFKRAINLQTQLALQTGVPTKSSAPHTLLNGFKNLVAVSAFTGYEFPQAQAILNAKRTIINQNIEKEPEAVIEEVKVEVEDIDMTGLFGDDDEY